MLTRIRLPAKIPLVLSVTGILLTFAKQKIHAIFSDEAASRNWGLGPTDRSIRLHPRHTCVQEHVGLSNAFLHNSAARAKHTRTHVGPYLSDLRCIVIGQYAMGRSLMDRSIVVGLGNMTGPNFIQQKTPPTSGLDFIKLLQLNENMLTRKRLPCLPAKKPLVLLVGILLTFAKQKIHAIFMKLGPGANFTKS